ncbi:E3 ubiquitin-protein ligase RNF170-like [Zootermopsis nevadensis]|uniref:E3 ubiquitin-protein ligase RNF170 n=1 Tax=Zootermopsis nevadensis TaxID=136037 RepID=A0A067QX78_ZOONE|nr:E3 ubiquitin-protein ligase RNF170-like [Zootermopsis nevadensis]KDR13975.1 RING finger protein 170 [Zootermopsis nevadensis]
MSSDYIYGIGNEVLTVAVIFIIGVLPLLVFAVRKIDWSGLLNSLGTHNWWIFSDQHNGPPPTVTNIQEIGNHIENVQPGVPQIPSRTYNPERCPICLHEHQMALETNCGHLYCGNCLRMYIYMNDVMSRISCPMCRQQISVLFVCFTERELQASPASTAGAQIQLLYRMVEEYNRSFSGAPRSFMEMVRDCPTLIRHLWNEFFSVGGLMLMFRVRIVLCFLAGLMYLFSPLDIIPEAVFGVLGLLDDLFVVFLLAIYISIIYRRSVVSRTMTM